ncbi:hypothetical protein ACFPRL_14340 [Pseudoclavibacter helvolus]
MLSRLSLCPVRLCPVRLRPVHVGPACLSPARLSPVCSPPARVSSTRVLQMFALRGCDGSPQVPPRSSGRGHAA